MEVGAYGDDIRAQTTSVSTQALSLATLSCFLANIRFTVDDQRLSCITDIQTDWQT